MSLVGPQFDLWRWQNTKCKILIPIFLFFPSSQSLTWRLPKPPIVSWLFGVLVSIVAFLLTSVALNVAQVLGFILFCYLGGINLNGWIALSPISLILLGDLSQRLIISRRRIVGLSLVFVFVQDLIPVLSIGIIFIFLNWWLITPWAPGVDLTSPRGWLKASFCFCIDNLFYHFIPRI